MNSKQITLSNSITEAIRKTNCDEGKKIRKSNWFIGGNKED